MLRIVLSASALVFVSSQAGAANCTAAPVAGELYSILNLGTGKVLDVTAGSTQASVQLQQWGYAASSNQQFYLKSAGNGYWNLQARHSGMLADVQARSTAEGAPVIQSPANGGANQQWQLKKSTTGAYNIVAVHSGKSLTVADANSGSKIYQATDSASGKQRWFLNPVSGQCGGTAGFAHTSGPDGLATTTGGGGATPVTVTSCGALANALKSNAAAVVQIPANTTIDCRTPARTQMACPVACPSYQDPGKYTYRIPVGTQSCTELGSSSNALQARSRNETAITVTSNKTLMGMGAGARVLGASFNVSGVKNVIIRRLAIEDVNPGLVEAGDAITVNNASHVWIDHVSFKLISDGHVDLQGSRNVTLSWNRFDGVNPAVCGSQHHYTNMAQDTQVTFHHNFWDRASGRNPKLGGAATRAHLFNNYWKDITYFSIGVGESAQAKVDGNYFANSARPHWNNTGGYIDANLASNRYTGVSGTDAEKDSGQRVFADVAMYPYTLDKVDDLPAVLANGAGNR